ncbi:MAG: hypothetical protein ACLQUY_02650 [Ktedonobacterales bacterium]
MSGWNLVGSVLADGVTDIKNLGTIAQAFAGILAGLIAVLGVPLALRQVVNLQRELRRYEFETRRKMDNEAILNISADYSLTRPAYDLPHVSHPGVRRYEPPHADLSEQPTPPAEPGKRVLRLDLTLENVGEGSVDILACLVAARELERVGEGIVSAGRDVQWEDLTPHYWTGDPLTCLSPGLSTTKHIVYAQDALVRIKSRSHKTLARIDQIRERPGQQYLYLLYRVFVAARRSTSPAEQVQAWANLQRALLNINAPAFRAVTKEDDPLGYAATPDGWRLFLHFHETLADPKLPRLRTEADHEELAIRDPTERRRSEERHEAELRAYCEKALLPAWKRFRAEYDRMFQEETGFQALLTDRAFRARQRHVSQMFPWSNQEIWTEYFYVTVEDAV